MNDKNSRNTPDGEGWVYPDRRPAPPRTQRGGGKPHAYGYDPRAAGRERVRAQNGGGTRPAPQRTAPKPPVHTRNAPMQGMSGARRTPQSFGSTARPGIRQSEPQKKSRGWLAVAALIALLILVLVIISVKSRRDPAPVPAETEPQITETDPPETEPEPPAPVYTYAERTDKTVQLGDEISCTHAILIDVDSNTVVAEKGGDDKIFPASMTKVMTALVAVEKCGSLDDTFTMTNEIAGKMYEAGASVAGFSPGEVITVKDLLYGSLLPSGGDGTEGLAEVIAGSEAEFSKLMNEKVAELGLKGTHFVTASGLHDDNHYSTCHDIAIIMKAAMDNETVAAALGSAEYVTTKTEQHPEGIELHHTLLYERLEGSEEFDEKIEVIGGKTGFTGEAGNCLVTMARVKSTGKRYIFVCAGGDSKWPPVFDTIHVYRKYLGETYDGEFVPKSQR